MVVLMLQSVVSTVLFECYKCLKNCADEDIHANLKRLCAKNHSVKSTQVTDMWKEMICNAMPVL